MDNEFVQRQYRPSWSYRIAFWFVLAVSVFFVVGLAFNLTHQHWADALFGSIGGGFWLYGALRLGSGRTERAADARADARTSARDAAKY